MASNPWVVIGLLGLSIVLTLLANWQVSGRKRPSIPRRFSSLDVAAIAASGLWIILLLFAGIVASRYIERIEHAALGFVCFSVVAGGLSWLRAILFHRLQRQGRAGPATAREQRLGRLVRVANYLLFAVVTYLLGAWVLQRSVEPILFIPLCLGALIPDLDSASSEIGRLLPGVSQWLQARFGQGQSWHSLAANGIVAGVTSPLILLVGPQAWAWLSLGFLSHLLLDLFTPQGAMLAWPLNHAHYSLLGNRLPARDLSGSPKLLAALGVLSTMLLLTVDIGPATPAPVPSPTYEQTLQRYYSLRGNYLVYAYVEGAWQASGRRTSGTFEILNAVGDSYIMVDRYSGSVFSAGRSAGDNLYLNRITLQTGSPASIKPIELHLSEQPLADGLAVLYEMQEEPGLQHIYASGDIIIAPAQNSDMPALQQDLSQTSLRRIQAGDEPGHLSLHYLTASDLISLAGIQVETADLVIVATYATQASEPTVTPLPTVNAASQPGP